MKSVRNGEESIPGTSTTLVGGFEEIFLICKKKIASIGSRNLKLNPSSNVCSAFERIIYIVTTEDYINLSVAALVVFGKYIFYRLMAFIVKQPQEMQWCIIAVYIAGIISQKYFAKQNKTW